MNEKIRVIGFSGGFSVLSREGSAGQYDSQAKLFSVAASVNPGDSGGPVLRVDSAEVLGVTVRRYERTGGGRIMQGHAEAIPATFVREFLQQALADAQRAKSSIAQSAQAELSGVKEHVRAFVTAMRDYETELAKLAASDEQGRARLYERMDRVSDEAVKRMEAFVKSARSVLSSGGLDTNWGHALWQAQAAAQVLTMPDIDYPTWRTWLGILWDIVHPATSPAGPCQLCKGKKEIPCRWCEGLGSCPPCRKKLNPECANCYGTGRCLHCQQTLKFPCLLCRGRGTWPD
jgi:hypothetical protein